MSDLRAAALFIGCSGVVLALQRVRRSASTGNFDVDEEPVLSQEQLCFYSKWTGQPADIEFIVANWRALKKRFHTYRCVQTMSYLVPRTKRLKAYNQILIKFEESKEVKIADFGCCFGQDCRQLIMEGIPPSQITVVDIHDGYWTSGLELFRDDAVANSRLQGIRECWFDISLPFGHPLSIESRFPDDVGKYDFVILQAVLHTLSLEQHKLALSRILRLLKKGSGVLMGATAGAEKAQQWVLTPDGQSRRYLHSQVSLFELLCELGYSNVQVAEQQRERVGEPGVARGLEGGWGRKGQGSNEVDQALAGVNRALIEFTACA